MANAALKLRHQCAATHTHVLRVCVCSFKCHHYRAHHRLHGKCPASSRRTHATAAVAVAASLSLLLLSCRLQFLLLPLPLPLLLFLCPVLRLQCCVIVSILIYVRPPEFQPVYAGPSACRSLSTPHSAHPAPSCSSTILTLLTKLHKLSAFVCLSGAGSA